MNEMLPDGNQTFVRGTTCRKLEFGLKLDRVAMDVDDLKRAPTIRCHRIFVMPALSALVARPSVFLTADSPRAEASTGGNGACDRSGCSDQKVAIAL